ncbi:AAA family ATPase [Arthrobacter agilis]|uniref:AAA family ATPase n=1 Tax=Arthrobacter agilis TaxID=37921 RepID=UPI00278127CC|nr:chromosome partitioning protein [Arthrobacter agilis]MDQ0735530.1 MinD-like ATPase involved in chromosome partitioning or flagellar assembly [Arthrobacter agilis]
MNIPVVTLGAAASAHVPGLEQLRGPVTVVRRCEDLPELVAACQSGLARAAILAPGAAELTASLVDRLRFAGVAVVALTDGAAAADAIEGVEYVDSTVGPAALADAVSRAVASFGDGADRPRGALAYADPLHRPEATGPPPADVADKPGEGRIMAVWGPAGSPGRTTVAINIAAELAVAGTSVLLVDADTYGASIGASLGLLDESAGLAQACRLADQGGFSSSILGRIAVSVAIKGRRLQVLTGITRPDRWPELRPAALAQVLDAARSLADVTVVDCGFCLEADEELSFDTLAPRRNGAALRCLELADSVIAVGGADTIGVPRLVKALTELADAVPTAAPRVVFNRVRAAAVGRAPEAQLREAWERFGPSAGIAAFLPVDHAAADRALLAGTALLETAPASALRIAIAELAEVPVAEGRRRRPFRRLGDVRFRGNPDRLPW